MIKANQLLYITAMKLEKKIYWKKKPYHSSLNTALPHADKLNNLSSGEYFRPPFTKFYWSEQRLIRRFRNLAPAPHFTAEIARFLILFISICIKFCFLLSSHFGSSNNKEPWLRHLPIKQHHCQIRYDNCFKCSQQRKMVFFYHFYYVSRQTI